MLGSQKFLISGLLLLVSVILFSKWWLPSINPSNDLVLDAGSNFEEQIVTAPSSNLAIESLVTSPKALLDEAALKKSLLNAQDPVDIEKQELHSLMRININYVIEQWRLAWEEGDLDRYLAYYSDHFTPSGGVSMEDWALEKEYSIHEQNSATISLSNFEVVLVEDDQIAIVDFDQLYTANDVRQETRKQLVLVKDDEDWRIIKEIVL